MSNDKINYYFYLLAFIDVLGQKEAFADLGNEPLTDDHPKLIEAHKQTAFFIETLRNAFKDFFDAYTEEREPKAKVPPEKMDQFKAMLKSILPVLTGQTYKGMNIEEGGEASRTFVNTFIKGQDAKNKDAVRKDLEDYCRLDTQAMVDVVKKLNEIAQK